MEPNSIPRSDKPANNRFKNIIICTFSKYYYGNRLEGADKQVESVQEITISQIILAEKTYTRKHEDDLSTIRCKILKSAFKEFRYFIWIRNISINIRTDGGVFQTGSCKYASFRKCGELPDRANFGT